MVNAAGTGEPTQSVLDEVIENTYKKATLSLTAEMRILYRLGKKISVTSNDSELSFLGIGVSGGVVAFENGYPLMVGGSKKPINTSHQF